MHETALDLLGPDGELRGALGRRLPVLALRPDLRRHQRGAAQRDRRADPRPPARGRRGPDGLPTHRRADRLRPVALRPDGPRGLRRGGPCLGRGRPRARAGPLEAAGRAGRDRAGAARGRRRPRRHRRSTSSSPSRCSATTSPSGPWIESAALAPQAEGEMVTAAAPPLSPYAVDADVATLLHGTRRRAVCARSTPPGTCSRSSGAESFDDDALDRATLAAPPQLLGLWRAPAGRLGGLRAAAQAVRPHDRVLPGDQAPARRRPDRPRLRPAAGARRRASTGCEPRRRLRRQGGRRRRGVPRLPGRAPGARRDRLHRRVRPRSLDQPGPGPRRGVGRRVVPPRPGRRLARRDAG